MVLCGVGQWRYMFPWRNKSSDVRKNMYGTDLATGITYLDGEYLAAS